MNYLIIDTETTSLDKPFCYDVGYKIIDENGNELTRKHFVIEQVWHNLPLFESAYYADKRISYVKLMRTRQAVLTKFGYAMQQLLRDIKTFNVINCYAYNSDFDDKVITYNCNWFKVINPLDNIPVFDIWGFASEIITNTPEYKLFCEKNQLFTDAGNYKTSAEVVYKYITNQVDFSEAHIGIFDVDIETEILLYCIKHGAQWDKDYKPIKILKREISKPFTIKVNNKVIYQGKYIKKYNRNDIYNFTEG